MTFPPWLGSFPYSSASSSSSFSISTDPIIINTTQSVIKRRSPTSSFGYRSEASISKTYYCDSESGSLKYTHSSRKSHPNPESNSDSGVLGEGKRFFKEEWDFLKRGRFAQSRVAAIACPVAAVGSAILVFLFLERREQRAFGRQRSMEKDREDWGDGFQSV
ncbi:uncharacterized protein RAG0_10843 [Rhynchosporium agropyri]|uniref:Uncharacterized protein n=1 Tax=Rhynchosporium agropyri TaxID=914238 RepID=A0A1E1L1H2_9HELO|nr:uncharacterized protein RAG0_10843 [Rhynchosporium agropyri]